MIRVNTDQFIAIGANPGRDNVHDTDPIISIGMVQNLSLKAIYLLLRDHILEQLWEIKPGKKLASAFQS